MAMRKKFIGIAALAFVATLSAGVASVNAQADTENTLNGFAITATSVRLDDTTKEGVDSGLRFKVDVPMGATVTDAYTTITLTTAGGQAYTTEVEATVWRTDNSGWNTVLLDIPESDYATQVTAKAYATINGTAYATAAETSSIAKTAAKAMANGTATAAQVGQYVSAATLSMSQAQATMFVGDEDMQLTATVNPDYPVIWSSSNQDVVTVDQTGKVSVVGKGAANVTATLGNKSVSCAITAYEKYEIDSVADFMAMPTGDEYAYCALTDDIDFAGTLIQYGVTPSGTTYAPIGTGSSKFSGILDGNGYAIKNVTVAGNGNGIFASVFAYVDGTIKNLFVDMAFQTGLISIKDSGFIYSLYGGALVENCYVKYASHATLYNLSKGTSIAPIASVFNVDDNQATIRNCVGVMDLSAGVTHPVPALGGAATLMGAIKKPNDGVEAVANLENCYGVMLTASGDTVHTARLDANDLATNSGTVNKDTSSAYGAMGDMYVAATTGMTAENGWNSFWTVDTANGILKFGDETLVDVYTISTAAEFLAMPVDDASAYCVLTQDINFEGVLVGYGAQYISNFTGVLNGCGYKIYNVTLVGEPAGETYNGIFAQVFGVMNGTLKNFSAELTLRADLVSSKRAGLINAITSANAVIENCYVKLTSHTAAYGTNDPVTTFVAYPAKAAVIRNCVAVFECTDNFAAINGGYATFAGRTADAGFTIENCYGVVLSKDNAQAAKLYCGSDYNSGYKTPTVVNSTAYTTLADMFTAAQTGMTAANGWNNLWTLDAAAGTLKFGATTVYAK